MGLRVRDLLHEARPKVVPNELAIVIHGDRHAEHPRFPGSLELQLAVLARDGQIVAQTFDARIAGRVGFH